MDKADIDNTNSRKSGVKTVIVLLIAILLSIAIAIGLSVGLSNRCKVLSIPIGDGLKSPPAKDVSSELAKNEHAIEGKENESETKKKSAFAKYQYVGVQTDIDQCSKVAMSVLVGMQGSAVDAAVAGLLCLGTVNPASSGIGGGSFMTIYQIPRKGYKKEMVTIRARETLPTAGHRDFFKNHSSTMGGSAIGIPGELHGLYTAWSRYGIIPWRNLVLPSIRLSLEGFLVEGSLAESFDVSEAAIRNDPELSQVFLKADGTIPKKGDVIKRPKYASTLNIIADDPMSFYNGSLAEDIVADLQERESLMTEEDLAGYNSSVTEPISGVLPGLNVTMYSPPPPSSGVILQFILRLLDGFGLDKNSFRDTDSMVETYHKLIETWKFAYAKRSALGDVNFINITELLRNLTNTEYIDQIRQRIDMNQTRTTSYYSPAFGTTDDSGTSHSNYLASDGSAVAATSSINFRFGAKVLGKRTGIIFNNEMDDFSVPGTINSYGYSPSPSNYPEAGKSPMSSMSPTIMLNDKGRVAYMSGANGGSRIISAVSYVALHNLYLGLGLDAATDLPRMHHQLLPDEIRVEHGFNKDIADGLSKKGHIFKYVEKNGACGTIRNHCTTCTAFIDCPQDCIEALADHRKLSGSPAGY